MTMTKPDPRELQMMTVTCNYFDAAIELAVAIRQMNDLTAADITTQPREFWVRWLAAADVILGKK